MHQYEAPVDSTWDVIEEWETYTYRSLAPNALPASCGLVEIIDLDRMVLSVQETIDFTLTQLAEDAIESIIHGPRHYEFVYENHDRVVVTSELGMENGGSRAANEASATITKAPRRILTVTTYLTVAPPRIADARRGDRE